MRSEIDRIRKMVYKEEPYQRGCRLTAAIISRVQNVLSAKSGPIDAVKKMLKKLQDPSERKAILLDRGSFRQSLIKQISTRMKSEFTEVLFVMLNYGSSKLYHPREGIETLSLQQRWMNDMWLSLLKQSNIIGEKLSVELDIKDNESVRTEDNEPNFQHTIDPSGGGYGSLTPNMVDDLRTVMSVDGLGPYDQVSNMKMSFLMFLGDFFED